MKRNPVVAGSFYSGYANVLRRKIESYLENADHDFPKSSILGVVSPHAGYVYSGQCAAYSYNALQNKKIKYAVVIAPSHRFASFRFSVGNFESYLTPLGEMPVSENKTFDLLQHEEFCFHKIAHQSEHSLEVQIPFLQVALPEVQLVPILLGAQSVDNSKILAEILAAEFQNILDETAFIISTDLSHYYTSEIAQMKDGRLIDLFEKLDEKKLQNEYHEQKIEACGIGGLFTLLFLAEKLKYDKIKTLQYTHSGKVSGEMSQVVGYLSAVVYK